MKKIVLIVILLITFSCEDALQPTDCKGVIAGTALIDDCGVCTGGTTELEANYLQDCNGTCGGVESDSDGDGLCDKWETVTDIDGNIYNNVKIGNQIWIAENLKVTHYNNGDTIQYVQDESSDPDIWMNLSTGAYGYYDDNLSFKDTYGNLYNWYAVNDSRGLCPENYHVPSDDEYKVLEMYLGMSESEADDSGLIGTNEGSKLAGNSDLWNDGSLENNSEFGTSGFNGFPSGYRYGHNGTYNGMGNSVNFWSSSEYTSYFAWFRGLSYGNSELARNGTSKEQVFSVRCIGD